MYNMLTMQHWSVNFGRKTATKWGIALAVVPVLLLVFGLLGVPGGLELVAMYVMYLALFAIGWLVLKFIRW